MDLDFKTISAIMTDPQEDKQQLLVLDNNILGLSKVLYYYNDRLNQFKGKYNVESLFPSAELLGIRMLLLQKIHRGEKVNLIELVRKKDQLLNPDIGVEDIDLNGTNLSLVEMKLLKDVIDSEPFFMDYLQNPFIVEALYRLGVAVQDDFSRQMVRAADYGEYGLRPRSSWSDQNRVRVSFLPSITKAYRLHSRGSERYPYCFKPDELYDHSIGILINDLTTVLHKLVKTHMFGADPAEDSVEQTENDARVASFLAEHVEFVNLDKRPLVIYPGNAEKVARDICPASDFNVIVLGKDVYLSLHIAEVDAFPHVNRLFLDIMDIKHDRVAYEIGQIGMFVFNKLKRFL